MNRHVEGKGAQLLLLTVVAIGMFMDSLDGSIVNIALPSMTRSFGIDTGTAAWIVTIYFLVVAGLILVFGKLAGSGWLKRIFIVGFCLFTIGSAFCAMSPSFAILLASRIIQGIGAAMIASSAMMICVRYLPPHMLGYGLSITVLGASLGVAAGPVIGGILTDIASWHWIFIINIPIGIAVILLGLRAIPNDIPAENRGRFDLGGAALLFVSLVSGLYVLETGLSSGIDILLLALLCVFALCMTVLVHHCRHTADPVLDLSLFRSFGFDAALIVLMLLNACYVGIQYLLPFYMEKGLGFDTLVSGLYLVIPAAITLVICSKAGRLSDRISCRPFMIAANIALIGAAAILFMIEPSSGTLPLISALILMGLIYGLGGGPGGSRVVENAPDDKKNAGSAMMSFIIYFGSALGTALFSAMFKLGSGSDQGYAAMTLSAFMDGFQFAMGVGLVLSVIGLILSAVVNEKKKERDRIVR